MNTDTWVFGYGSLVSPTSLASTIGRHVDPHDIIATDLHGYGRRWNYGSLHLRGDWRHDDIEVRQGVVISLGLVAADDEHCNGVAVRVTEEELSQLDWRERDYERTDVTDRIDADRIDADRIDADRIDDDRAFDGLPIVTYVPRSSAVERYEAARNDQRAAIRRSYWDLVSQAFADLGDHHSATFASTPAPDVPVLEMTLSLLG